MALPEPILLSGGTGLVGGRTLAALADRAVAVRALTRRPKGLSARPGIEPVGWDGLATPPEALAGTRAVVHLAGEPVFGGLATRSRRKRIYTSRIDSTRHLVDAIADLPAPDRPQVLVCASAVGYYGDRGELELRETDRPGAGFLAQLCVDWEREAARVQDLGVRPVSLRFGVVLAREGGALASMARVFRMGLGGRIGSGVQWFPWIHLGDAVSLVLASLESEGLRGPVNAVAPHPVRNADFTEQLARAVGRRALLPAPAFAVRAALGPLSGELLGSRRVVPERARSAGFGFAYPELEPALAHELDPAHELTPR